jgi:hypothetical protein
VSKPHARMSRRWGDCSTRTSRNGASGQRQDEEED